MGVSNINICANINIGGYAWSKYGFCAESRNEALYVCNRVKKEFRHEAEKIVLDWYNKNGDKPFPMMLLAEHPWGKEAMFGSSWYGVLDMKDEAQLKVLKKYIGL